MESNKYFAVATVLDPRFKDKVFSTMSSGMIAKQMLTCLYEVEAQKDDLPSDSASTQETLTEKLTGEGSHAGQSYLLWSFCRELIADQSQRSLEFAESEVKQYLKEPNIPNDSKFETFS